LNKFFYQSAWTLIFTLVGLSAPLPSYGHPTQFHTAAHEIRAQIDFNEIRLVYKVKLPVQPGEAIAETKNRLANEEVSHGILLEVNGDNVPWQTQGVLSITNKSQSVEAEINLRAAITNWPARIRVSNGNLIDTRAFFSNTLLLTPGLKMEASLPVQQQNNGKLANLMGIWTMDPKSRDLRLQLDKRPSLLETFHHWTVSTPLWLAADGSRPNLWSIWATGGVSPPLTLFIALLSGALGLLTAFSYPRTATHSVRHIVTYLIVISGCYLFTPPESLSAPIGVFFLVSTASATSFRKINLGPLAPVLATVGPAYIYGAAPLAVFGLAALLGLTLSGTLPHKSLSTPYRVTSTLLFICGALLGLWRML